MTRSACVAFVLALLLTSPATADDGPHAGANDAANVFNAATTVSSAGTSVPGAATATSLSTGPTYTYVEQCGHRDGISVPSAYGCDEPFTCGEDGTLYTVYAHYPDDSTEEIGVTCIEPGDPEAQQVLTPGMVLKAFRRIPLPETPLVVQPPGGRTLVNFDTLLHTDAQPFTRSVRLLGRRVTFDITPSTFTWHLGHGATLSTDDPGRAYQRGLPSSAYVSYRYLKPGQETLSLTTTWTARWRVGGGPWRDVGGTVDTSSSPQDLQVTTAAPQLISYD